MCGYLLVLEDVVVFDFIEDEMCKIGFERVWRILKVVFKFLFLCVLIEVLVEGVIVDIGVF